ncbi:ameloblastin [Dendropsophus ebraccatus]|uniref:ameloblastin n=1 Tax=Dendropsophus ebraccatus TaxID=150705 RepID=UPI00383115C7
MEELALVLCMLGTVFTFPMYPQSAGTHGMASVSLETLQQQQTANKLTALPQFSRFGYNDPYSSLWLHGLLPTHSTFPWLHQRPQMPDNQQFEYAVPIHPPPLPGVADPAKPNQDTQAGTQKQPTTEQFMQSLLPLGYPNPADPTLTPPKGGPADGQIQTVALFMYQTIMNKLLQQGAGDPVPDPAAGPPTQQQHLYPGLFFMNYGGGPGGPPARLGVMSSEELQGGRAGAAHALNSLYTSLLGAGSGLGRLPQNPAFAGDFTIEDDSPGAGVNPAGQGAAKNPAENPSVVGSNPPIPGLEGVPPGQGDAMLFPNMNQPNMAFNPLGQSMFPPAVTPAYTPKVTLDAALGFAPYGIDETLTFGGQREIPTNVDMTHTNSVIDSPIMHSDIHLQHHYFQEP